MAKKGIKVAATIAALAVSLTGAVTLSACGGKKSTADNSSYADLLEERDSHMKELERIEKELNSILSRDQEVKKVKDSVKNIQDKISYEKIDGPEVLEEISKAEYEIDEIVDKGLIDPSEGSKLKRSLGELEKGVFYSVFANGIETRAASDPIIESMQTKTNNETLRTQTAVDFGMGRLIKNQVTSADMMYSNVSVIENGLMRDCVVGETYKEEAGQTISRKDFVDEYKTEMKATIAAASDLSYDVTEGYKVVSTAEYQGETLDTTVVYNVDDKGALTTLDQTFEAGNEVVAEIGIEYTSVSSSNFNNLYDRAVKTLDQQKQILAGDNTQTK